jgi:hypothetical protein
MIVFVPVPLLDLTLPSFSLKSNPEASLVFNNVDEMAALARLLVSMLASIGCLHPPQAAGVRLTF